MITAQEYTEKKPAVIWIHGLDLLSHILKGDYRQTAYKDGSPSPNFLRELSEQIGATDYGYDRDKLAEAVQDVEHPEFKARPFRSESGDLEVDRLLEGDSLPFDDYRKDRVYREALSIVFDAYVGYGHREGGDIKEKHERIYRLVTQAEADGRPCRVIAGYGLQIPESRETLRIYIVVKDYADPIFPALWGALQDNRTANSLINCVSDYLIGTCSPSNGHWVDEVNIAPDMPEDEEVVLFAGRSFIYKPGH